MEELTKNLAEASGIAEYREIKSGAKIPTVPVVAVETTEKPSVAAPVAETTEKPEAQAQESIPEKTEPIAEPAKRDRSAEGRVKELRAEGRHEEADKILREAAAKVHRERADRLEQELQQYRTRKPEPEPVVTKQPAASTAPIDPNDPEPQFTDPKYSVENGFLQFTRDQGKWDRKQEAKQQAAETQKQQAESKDIQERQELAKKMQAARVAYDDFDESGVSELILSNSMLTFAKKHPDGVDVLYRLGKDREEFSRIYALDSDMQAAELGGIARDIRRERQALPVIAAVPALEKPKPQPVSKIAPVVPRLSGAEKGSTPKLSDAKNLQEWRAARHR